MSIAWLRKLENEVVNLAKLSGPYQQKIQLILGSYDLKLKLVDSGVVRIGRGSITAMAHIEYFQNLFSGDNILEVGRFCEFGGWSSIHLAGEHRNDCTVNLGFGWHAVAQACYEEMKVPTQFRSGNTRIGHNVIIGAGARVLAGRQLADGVVIGANALVTKDAIVENGIYAGQPATLLRLRNLKYKLPWWNLPLSDILDINNKDDLSGDLIKLLEEKCLHDYTRGYEVGLVATGKSHSEFKVSFESVWVSGREIKKDKLPKYLSDYLSQIESDSKDYYYSPNIFMPFENELNALL